ncbi:hypothetical protein B0H14DRAFT_3158490 [Mycena olivaceomarginata]|nr:hypothetical protein B0H14DRAFT_3158490 [Mycena olivaceomarginata]
MLPAPSAYPSRMARARRIQFGSSLAEMLGDFNLTDRPKCKTPRNQYLTSTPTLLLERRLRAVSVRPCTLRAHDVTLRIVAVRAGAAVVFMPHTGGADAGQWDGGKDRGSARCSDGMGWAQRRQWGMAAAHAAHAGGAGDCTEVRAGSARGGQDESGVGDGEQLQRALLRTVGVGWDGAEDGQDARGGDERGARGGAAAAGAGDVGAMFGMRPATRAVRGGRHTGQDGRAAQGHDEGGVGDENCERVGVCGGTVDSATAGAAGSRGGWRTSCSSEAETDEAKERRWEVLHGGPADSCAAEGRHECATIASWGFGCGRRQVPRRRGRRAWGCSSVECRPGRRRGDASTVVVRRQKKNAAPPTKNSHRGPVQARGGRMVVGRRREGEWGLRRRRSSQAGGEESGILRVVIRLKIAAARAGVEEGDMRDEERQRLLRVVSGLRGGLVLRGWTSRLTAVSQSSASLILTYLNIELHLWPLGAIPRVSMTWKRGDAIAARTSSRPHLSPRLPISLRVRDRVLALAVAAAASLLALAAALAVGSFRAVEMDAGRSFRSSFYFKRFLSLESSRRQAQSELDARSFPGISFAIIADMVRCLWRPRQKYRGAMGSGSE